MEGCKTKATSRMGTPNQNFQRMRGFNETVSDEPRKDKPEDWCRENSVVSRPENLTNYRNQVSINKPTVDNEPTRDSYGLYVEICVPEN